MRDGILERDDNFAANLKRLRIQQNLTEQDLADKLGCNAQCIREYEANVRRPHTTTVDQINHALLGRTRFGLDTPDGRPYLKATVVNLEHVPDEVLVAELRRRWHTGN